MIDKTIQSAALAVRDVPAGASIAFGGFGICGIPQVLIQALADSGTSGVAAVGNNCGVDDWGLGLLLQSRSIRRMTASYVGENKEFARQYLAGELELELIPQGTLAERLRAGGVGVPAFYTPAGVGTLIAEGGVPIRYAADGSVAESSAPREVRHFGDGDFVLERAIKTDFAFVRAAAGDRHGNLVYAKSAQNFNPLVAMAGRVTIAEVETLVEPGDLDPDHVHTPGVFVQHVLPLSTAQAADKRIERITTRGA